MGNYLQETCIFQVLIEATIIIVPGRGIDQLYSNEVPVRAQEYSEAIDHGTCRIQNGKVAALQIIQLRWRWFIQKINLLF